MSYPNLNPDEINRSTIFFNLVDTNNDGLISLQEIYDACYTDAVNTGSYLPPGPNFIATIITLENFTNESSITQQQYENLQAIWPILSDAFSLIDTNNDGFITTTELQNHYDQVSEFTNKPISYHWLKTIKTAENLTDESQLTLEQFLHYQDMYNTIRYWPNNL